jgi:hypothetical protein
MYTHFLSSFFCMERRECILSRVVSSRQALFSRSNSSPSGERQRTQGIGKRHETPRLLPHEVSPRLISKGCLHLLEERRRATRCGSTSDDRFQRLQSSGSTGKREYGACLDDSDRSTPRVSSGASSYRRGIPLYVRAQPSWAVLLANGPYLSSSTSDGGQSAGSQQL